jgi:hypothetical protein
MGGSLVMYYVEVACELPTPEGCWLPASTIRLGPHAAAAEASVDETVPAWPVWKAGYGGPGLHRRNLPAPCLARKKFLWEKIKRLDSLSPHP